MEIRCTQALGCLSIRYKWNPSVYFMSFSYQLLIVRSGAAVVTRRLSQIADCAFTGRPVFVSFSVMLVFCGFLAVQLHAVSIHGGR